jgi:3D (Asp-Asp-Asp) domain-containing protein
LVRLFGTLMLVCALALSARAEEPTDELPFGLASLPEPERIDRPATLPPPQNELGDASKVSFAAPDKGPAPRGKIKECCGYPLAASEPGFKISFYWLAYEQEYANEPYDTDIYTRQGYWIGRYPSTFVFELKLEGSGILRDGRVLNYAGDCNYGIGTCFKFLELEQHPLGAGVQGRKLEPFRSVAVDPKMIPIGAPIYIPELAGTPMPDGSIHDGCVRADDQGGAIKNGKIDFFVESWANYKWIGDAMWWQLKITPTVEEPRCEYLRTGELRERDNERSDWASLHQKWRSLARAERVAAARTARNRRVAQKWLKRHQPKTARGAVAKR